MGHIRLGRLPASRKWQDVVGLLSSGAPVDRIAGASAGAAQASLRHAHDDPALVRSFWLLTQLPLAARSPDYLAALAGLGLAFDREPTLLELTGSVVEAVDRHVGVTGGRTNLGEMAQLAAAESLAAVVGAGLPSLFGPTPGDVRSELGKYAGRDRFAVLARDYFARLTNQHLDYYLSRELSNHTGPHQSIASTVGQTEFNEALAHYCREASRIVVEFAGGWFSKTVFEGGITPEKAGRFVFVALGKISRELQQRAAADG